MGVRSTRTKRRRATSFLGESVPQVFRYSRKNTKAFGKCISFVKYALADVMTGTSVFAVSPKYTMAKCIILLLAAFPMVHSTAHAHRKPCEKLSPDGTVLHVHCGYTNITKEYLKTYEDKVVIADFQHNNLTYFDPEVFTVYPNLKKLFLDNNPYLRTTAISHKTLEVISFADCGLEEFNVTDLKNLPSLKCVRAGGNNACAIAQVDAEEQCTTFGVDCGSGCPALPYVCSVIPEKDVIYILVIFSVIFYILFGILFGIVLLFFIFLVFYRRSRNANYAMIRV